MAPPQANTSSKNANRLDAFVAFAQDTQKRLPTLKEESEIYYMIDALENQIRATKAHTTHGCKRNVQLVSVGTDLWNLCIRLNHDSDDFGASMRKLLLFTRVFAFHILVIAHGTDCSQPDECIRLNKLAIKIAKSCIDADETDFALHALQKAVDYNGSLKNLQDKLPEAEQSICRRLEAEYFILRTIVVSEKLPHHCRDLVTDLGKSWKESRLDVAEHMYGKSETLRQKLDPASAENLTDALFEIGNDLLQKHDFPLAVKWLERAYELINSQELEQLSREAIELRLSILQALIRSLLGLNTSNGFEKAENHVAFLESEVGDKLVVLLLRLEILQKAPAEVFDSDAYANILRRMIRAINLSESTFKLLLNHIRKLDDKSPTLAVQIHDQFLFDKVIPSENGEWIERATLLRVMLSTNRRDSSEMVQGLKSVFDRTTNHTKDPLTANTALAILTLIWKKIESSFTQNQLSLCESWCQLASHPLLERSGPVNAGKIARKLILCALEKNDLDSAQEAFQAMGESMQRQPMTMYLAYKLALRSGNASMATKCIESIAESASKEPKFLYACCLEAQQSGDRLCTLKALKLLAEQHEFSIDSNIHFPALLRSMIRVQVSILDSKDVSGIDIGLIARDLCDTFEGVVTLLQKDPRDRDGCKIFSVAELNWFSKNAYNLGVKHTSDWDLSCIIRMCSACVSITRYYPNDLPSHETSDISLRGMFCDFVIATAYIALARSEDNIEIQLQDYLSSRKHVEGFEAAMQRANDYDDDCNKDLRLKLATLLVFDFEASVHLKAWDDLGNIIRKAGIYKDLQTLQAMADSLLRVQPPAQVLYSSLRTLINEIFELEKFDSEKLAKYMRCLLRIIMSDADLSLRVIDETCRIIKQAAETKKPFPQDETHWFATTAFNQAIDYNLSKEDELCRKWIGHAFSLAHYLEDGGVLEKTMHDHYAKLNWGST